MTEQLDTQASVAGNGNQPEAASEVAASAAFAAADRPEIPVAAAFAGGFLMAMILKRIAR